MYLETKSNSREGWRYTYSGGSLLPYAQKKLSVWEKKEDEARQKMAALLQDRTKNVQGDESQKLTRDIEKFATERETCIVFVHEFGRKKEENYSLTLGDVVYFGIAGILEGANANG